MEGGLIPTKVAVGFLALVVAVAGFFTWQAAADKQSEEDERVCQLTAALSDTPADC